MTAKHKNPSHTPPEDNESGMGEEKLFDFDRSFDKEEDGDQFENGNERLKELETSLSETKEKHLRLLAEFDNYKKRTSKERYELLSTASKSVILALLPVVDDFERALKSGGAAQDESHTEGISLIYNRLLNVMQSQGLKAMESTGEAFDPDLHEAIADMPVEDPEQKGKVIDTIEKGYMLNDKIIRHAKVIVGK